MKGPRTCHFMAGTWPNQAIGKTWLESEAFCYPNGGMKRRFCARDLTGKLHTGWAGIPDTFFSIPATIRHKGKLMRGWLGVDEEGFIFHFYRENEHGG